MTEDSVQTRDLFAGPSAWRDAVPAVLVVLAGIASAALVWWPTQSAALAGGFAGAALLAAALLWATRSAIAAPVETVEVQDWSLVRSLAQGDGDGIAITDRTGKLVCANDLFIDWFGGPITPPNLPLPPGVVALFAQAGKSAWRDGEAAVAAFPFEGREMTASITRIGRNADHLLWRWSIPEVRDVTQEAAALLNGAMGARLGESGVMAALVSANGTTQAANSALRLRAMGAIDARAEGQDFAQMIRMDQRGALRFVRDRDNGPPLRIIELPLDDQGNGPLLLLLLDDDAAPLEPAGSADHVERMVDALPFALGLVDRDGRLIATNAAFRTASGLSTSDAPPSYPGDLVVAEDKAAFAEAVRRHGNGRATTGGIGVRMRNTPDTLTQVSIVGVRGMGAASVVLAITRDAEGDGDLRQKMAQATKMQAVGQLAGGIAHDFNNILTAILGNCDLMLLRHTPGDSDYDDIQQVRSNTNRAANLTRQLLAFSRQQTLRPQILNLSDIVADVSHLLQRLIGEHVKLAVQHGRGLGPVRADPVQLEQVIVNLAVNARDAMADAGGTLTIATRALSADQVRAQAPDFVAAGEYSLLEVSDTGSGIPAHILPKIFDPFFTTKDVGKGTGLGLATVYGIVKQSGGYIIAESQPGKGTRFSIYLPVYQGSERPEALQTPPPAQVARSTHWGSGTILLVEDEEMVRAVAERALVRAGYTVVTAEHGEAGLEKFAAMADVDLVISDVMMPQMDGPAMVQSIRQRRADVPVLFMSGYAEEQLRQSIALPNVAFLAKPFSVAQLVDAVARIKEGA